MDKDTELKALVKEKIEECEKNKYSIYDYLKKTPSVFIAGVSAIIAVVTFFARLMASFSLKKELLFWDINPGHLTANDSIIDNAVVSIIYAFLTIVLTMWFSATYEAYASHRSIDLTMRYFKKKQKREIKKIKTRISKGVASKDEKDFVANINDICTAAKEVKKDGKKEFFWNSLPIYLSIFVVTLFFATVTINGKNVFLLTIVCFAIQILTLYLLSRFHTRKLIDRKTIKSECANTQFILTQLAKIKSERFQISKISQKGIRSYMSNANIIMVAIMLLANCFTLCISTALIGKDPIKESNHFQTVSLDNTMYAIVYQNGTQCFLEEAEIVVQNNEDTVPENVLIIYTNKQRILTYDDIVIDIVEYDDIIKKQKADDSEERLQCE